MAATADALFVRRPERWDRPLDPSMTAAEVAWLRSRHPFSELEAAKFPKSVPLDGVLQNDCRILRVRPGEVIVRAGDYGGSAYFVLAGDVRVDVDGLTRNRLGRRETAKMSWTESLRRLWRRSPYPETRTPDQVNCDRLEHETQRHPGVTDDRPALFLQDFGPLDFNAGSESDPANRDAAAAMPSLGPGDMFGEIAAMYRTPHSATVVAGTEATLIEIRWQGLRMLRRDAGFAKQLELHYRKHWLIPLLKRMPLLRYLSEESLQTVADATQLRSFGRIEWNAEYRRARRLSPAEQIAEEPVVIEEGNLPTDLILVRSGFARACVAHGAGHRTTAYLGAGHWCGLTEAAYNSLRPPELPPMTMRQTIRAVGFLDTLHIPIETFAVEILPSVRASELPEAVRQWTGAARQSGSGASDDRRRRSRTPSLHPLPVVDEARGGESTGHRIEHTGRMEFIVEHRLFNGREAMVIDLHRCTRCDDCVRACAATHDGNPRFVRDGLSHGRLQFVQACMHCTDPVCMVGCPTGAIYRDESTGVVGIEESICVGCGLCAKSCPYENIRMAEIRDPQGRPYRDVESGLPIMKATACDMCREQPAGPACTAACPHDALARIDLTEPGPLQQWLKGR